LIPETVIEKREEQGVYFVKTSLKKSDNQDTEIKRTERKGTPSIPGASL
jgi:hypothetical protein